MIAAYLNILVVFAIILLSYILTWKKWFDSHVADVFSKLVLNITLPLSMFLNMTQKFTREEFLELFKGIALPFVSILITFGISFLYAKLTKVPISRRGSFMTMFTAANTIFMGLPVNMAVFGEKAIPYALLYYICNTTFFFTVGIMLIAKDNPEIKLKEAHFSFKKLGKQLMSPALMGFIVGILWLLTGKPVPKPLFDFSSYIGGMTTALSLFVIGIIIYETGIKNLKMNKDVAGVLIGRYLISPLVVYLVSFVIPVPPLMLQVFILQSAMPVQNAMPILSRSYGADEEFATSCLTYSILSYFVFILVILKLFM
ncbi:AEC family transporter [Vagococcus sp. DIV0080]|uniref:AEC family transporter n=1 Tax=Candidatus Vagococcus giribetii TaxID=2230876 RepID=A0ABS3HST6_9ENTE|nr:AEC family transporter [Vagococcus sp. DIV0080]MBO0476779.1 AEC family transporter [Vagococcus sp. DIV0080]